MQNVCDVRAGVATDIFLKKKCKYVCKSANVQNFARPHACEVCAMCVQVWWAESFLKFLKKCVQKCKCAKFRTSARVRNVCDVRASVLGGVNLKFFEINVCKSANVRNFAHPHTRTRAKCA